MRGSIVFFSVFLLGLGQTVNAQDVVSASSGVLHYFEGTVILDNKSIEHKAAVFPSLTNGATIRTEKGKAELMLTPGAYLRLDDRSSMRMVSNSLVDTRLELTGGSAILDTLNTTSAGALVISYEGSEVRFPKPGIYRLDSDVGELQVYSGECSVKHHGETTAVDATHLYYFALQITTRKFGDGATDEFYDWASNRSDVIANQNQLASADQNDPLDADPGGAGGMFVVPPIYSSPGYATSATPAPGYSTYGGASSPFYVYQPAPYSLFASSVGIIVLPPYRHRPGGTHWPVTTTGTAYHPAPGIANYPTPGVTRWPSPARGGYSPMPTNGLSHLPVTGLSYPVRPPVMHPGSTVPRVTSPPAAPHISTPHIGGAVGHR